MRNALRWLNKHLATFALVIALAAGGSSFYYNNQQTQQDIETVCKAVTQVNDALGVFLKPVTTKGITDPALLKARNEANLARTKARKLLNKGLACAKI